MPAKDMPTAHHQHRQDQLAAPAAGGRRPALARAVRRARMLPAMRWLRTTLRHDIRILAYHRVLEQAEPEGFRFDPALVSASAEAFREQLRVIRRHHAPLRFDELADMLDRGRAPPKRAVLITFDDGYDDNHRVAFPLLREAGLSAMFFVSTGHIDSGRPFAYDWLVHMLSVTTAPRLVLPELGIDVPIAPSLAARRSLAAFVLDRMKVLGALEQQALVERLEGEWGLPASAGHPDCRPMDWDMVRAMHDGGMEIGSHGIDHLMLAKLPPERMRAEVLNSKRTLDAELGQPVVAISYPVGGYDAWDAGVLQAARDAGFRIGCSYLAGAERAREDDRMAMRRIPVEREMHGAWFEAMLAVPEVFCYRSRERHG